MRIVLDTNCLLVALPQHSPYHCIWNEFRKGKFILCYSTEILQEYEELLGRNYSHPTISIIMEILLSSPNTHQVIPYFKWNVISIDPDDNKFVDCALNAGADFIVTNDKHFNILKKINFPPINVIDIEGFKKILHD